MARPGRPERNRAARSFRQLRRFHHVINTDKVFGTHTALAPEDAGDLLDEVLLGRALRTMLGHQRLLSAKPARRPGGGNMLLAGPRSSPLRRTAASRAQVA